MSSRGTLAMAKRRSNTMSCKLSELGILTVRFIKNRVPREDDTVIIEALVFLLKPVRYK